MIVVSEEVREASAVVALETTLIAHGFPGGEGVAVGLESERLVREAGAVPATIGVLDGELRVGLTEDELTRFDAGARKVGPRDLAACVVQGAIGATTVGGTLAVCRAAGIRFMGTGGLGGVHRGFPHPPDVSADLGGGGLLLARPPDRSLDDVEPLIEEALAEAERRGVTGQAVTPFVLSFLHERSEGQTLVANRELVVANAGLAAEVAVSSASA